MYRARWLCTSHGCCLRFGLPKLHQHVSERPCHPPRCPHKIQKLWRTGSLLTRWVLFVQLSLNKVKLHFQTTVFSDNCLCFSWLFLQPKAVELTFGNFALSLRTILECISAGELTFCLFALTSRTPWTFSDLVCRETPLIGDLSWLNKISLIEVRSGLMITGLISTHTTTNMTRLNRIFLIDAWLLSDDEAWRSPSSLSCLSWSANFLFPNSWNSTSLWIGWPRQLPYSLGVYPRACNQPAPTSVAHQGPRAHQCFTPPTLTWLMSEMYSLLSAHCTWHSSRCQRENFWHVFNHWVIDMSSIVYLFVFFPWPRCLNKGSKVKVIMKSECLEIVLNIG